MSGYDYFIGDAECLMSDGDYLMGDGEYLVSGDDC